MTENSLRLGQILLKELQALKKIKPYIKDVRGRGLFCAIEFEENSKLTAYGLCKVMMKKGLLAKTTHDTAIRFSPPLIITEE